MSSVLIGGTGFIGSALSSALARQGEFVLSLSRKVKDAIPGVQYGVCDVSDSIQLVSYLEQGDDIFILTGQTGPDFDTGREKENLKGIAKVIRELPSKRVFYASSAYVYGNTDMLADETSVCQPIEPYSRFKLEAEEMLRSALSKNQLVIFRIANAYGSPQNRGFIGLVMRKLFGTSEDPLLINGDGNQKRDYIFIDDVVQAMVAVKKLSNTSDIINIASGKSVSLLDIVEKISEISGKQISYTVTNVFFEEIRHLSVSNDKLRIKYQYEPQTFLEEGLRRTVERCRKSMATSEIPKK